MRPGAHEPDPVPGLADAAVCLDDLYVGESFAQRVAYLVSGECGRPDDFGQRFTLAVPLNRRRYLPVERGLAGRPYPDAKVVLAELLKGFRNVRDCRKVIHGEGVEGEHAALVQMPVRAVEESLPGREAEQVIDSVVDAEHGVEPRIKRKAAHVGQLQQGSLG